MNPTFQQQIGVLQEQQSAITQALKAMDEGRWTGDGSVEAYLLALNPTWQGQLASQTPLYVSPPEPPDELDLQWIGSPNHFTGRAGYGVCAIVIHTMAGTLASCDSWFNNPSSQVSAHFGIGLGGEQHQYVALTNGAWANGILEPGNTWPCGSGNPNYMTVSVETEDNGSGATAVTDQQYSATLAVCEYTLATYPNITWLLGHHCISPSSRPQCCGDRWRASGRFQMLAEDLGLEARY